MSQHISTPGEVGDLLFKAIQIRTKEIIEAEMADTVKRVEAKVRGEVGYIAAKVLTRFRFESFGTELTIKVDFANTKT